MPQLPRHIALINQKGGVGKTTTTANLAAALARAGRRVLLVDLDPQSHLTMHLGVDPAADGKPTIYDVLTDNAALAEAVRPTAVENIRIAPATIDLAAAEVELVGVVGREVLLRDALATLRADPEAAYDYLLLDCPPSLGLLTLNALSAATEVLICLQPHFLALQGVGKLLETVGLVAQRINASLTVGGVVLCMYDFGTKLAGEVTADLANFLAESRGKGQPWSSAEIFKTCIRRNIKLAECPSFGQVIFQYAPGSHGAQDYAKLADEVMAMEGAGVPASRAVPGPVNESGSEVQPSAPGDGPARATNAEIDETAEHVESPPGDNASE
ncbi:MAG: AAA family ATPase [Phycisphaerae bacterium]|nr:AAA family ATPase [Phycisphaerae bacterium]